MIPKNSNPRPARRRTDKFLPGLDRRVLCTNETGLARAKGDNPG